MIDIYKKRGIVDIFTTPNKSISLHQEISQSSVFKDFDFVGNCFDYAGKYLQGAIDATTRNINSKK